MKTSIIIWTYNQLGHLLQCVDSIRRYTDFEQVELIIIDGHSVDGTREWLKTQPDLIVICYDQSLSYLKGCNEGIKIASGDNALHRPGL